MIRPAPSRLRTRSRAVPLEVWVTVFIALIVAGDTLRRSPWTRDPVPEELVAPPPPAGAAGADVLVLLPDVPPAESLAQVHFDQAWVSAVEQEVGAARIARAAQLTRADLDGAAWVIVPRTAASQFDPAQVQFLRNWVQDGGTALVEQPEGPWESVAGQVFGANRLRESRRITSYDGGPVRGALREALLEMPLLTTLAVYNPPTLARGRDYEVLAEVDGLPGAVALPIGRGRVVLVLFDAGRILTTMQQGSPREDLTVDTGELERPPVASDLVVTPGMRTARAPYADLLERNLLYLLDATRPVARLWSFPATHRGALLATHSEAAFGPRMLFMAEWERAHGQAATVFAVAGSLAPEPLARLERIGSEVQLQWAPAHHPAAPQRTWGIRTYRAIRRPMSLVEQRADLAHRLLPYPAPIANRTIDGAWTTHWTTHFAAVEAAGVTLDLTPGPYHPPPPTPTPPHHGDMLGAGLPFRPIAPNGDRYGVRVLPTLAVDGVPGYSASRVRDLLVQSSAGFHTAVVVDWRPDTMARRPSHDALEGWRQAFDLAASQGLWVATVAEFAEFVARRDASRVRSTFSAESRRLVIDAEIVGPAPGEEDPASVTPSIAFAARYEARPVSELLVNGVPRDPAALDMTGDRVLLLLPLPAGQHRVEVWWAPPTETVAPPAE